MDALAIYVTSLAAIISVIVLISTGAKWYILWLYTYKVPVPAGYVIEYNGYGYRFRNKASDYASRHVWGRKGYAIRDAKADYDRIEYERKSKQWKAVE